MDFLRRIIFLSIVCFWAVPALAAFDFSSPGPLSSSHEKIDGSSHCDKCHEKGKQVVPQKCLDCHKELAARVTQGKGFHGRMTVDAHTCAKCHPEHAGRALELVKWESTRERFDHALTGYLLEGKHKSVNCDQCHDKRLVQAPDVKAMLESARHPTYLGLSTQCGDCHFDEHRGQAGAKCESCHDETDWKRALKFSHRHTAFPLEGKHVQVPCVKCHVDQVDTQTLKSSFPTPRRRAFLKFKGMPFESCENCHKDVHEGKFGKDCAACHTPADWRQVLNKEISAPKFHDRTRFPLRGAHAKVQCKSCHGPFAGMKRAKFKGLAFELCTDCHVDSHLGQISLRPEGKKTCDRCHTIDSFIPADYDVADHARTRYPLKGGHEAVPCASCHPKSQTLLEKIPSSVRKKLKAQGRREQFSVAIFKIGKPLDRCETCHVDPHMGQFQRGNPPKSCADCHQISSFRETNFDHDRDTRYKLTGKHEKVACNSCHITESRSGKEVCVYRGLGMSCEDCHVDVHVGQFAKKPGEKSPCKNCHTTEAFKGGTLFDHGDPRFTRFGLTGKHASVKCERCHRTVTVAENQKAVRYKPLPVQCVGCHADPHRGAFRKYYPDSRADRCEQCHQVSGWFRATFDHSKTGFVLKGAHSGVRCRLCHEGGTFEKRIDHSCQSCHKDIHAGQLGQLCEKCHDEVSWRGTFSAESHRRTNFPLTGRHALIPCEECHLEVREKTFSRATLDCVACHQADYQRTGTTSVDHVAAGFGTNCRSCHHPSQWRPARFGEHDNCFVISRGAHSPFRCADCHTSTTALTTTGTCSTGNVSCTGCHTGAHSQSRTDSEHREVPGYQYKDRKCYECHRIQSSN